jgi:hypothetical protein
MQLLFGKICKALILKGGNETQASNLFKPKACVKSQDHKVLVMCINDIHKGVEV